MKTQATPPKMLKRILELLSHPAWNGMSCFFTALSTFGLGSIALAYILGLFRHVQDFLGWLLAPVVMPIVVLLGGVVIILAFISTAAYRSILASRIKQDNAVPNPIIGSKPFIPSELDIEMMKQLAVAKEKKSYWVEVSAIAAKHKLTENRADYSLRILEKHGFIFHNVNGNWGIKDKGIDYLIEYKHI